MFNVEKTFPDKFNDYQVGILTFVLLVASIAGTVFLASKNLQAGVIYLAFMAGGVVAFVFLTTFAKDEDKPNTVLRVPLAKKFSLSAVTFLLGLLTPLGFTALSQLLKNLSFKTLIPSVVRSFSIVPLFAGEILGTTQSFAVAEIAEKASTQLFNIGFVAGLDEALIFGWFTMHFGVAIGYFVLKALSKEGTSINNPFVLRVFGYATSGLLFVGAHKLNGSYQGYEFLVAFIFMMVHNITIYEGAIPITFWMGFHMTYNILFLMKILGIVTTLNGFLSIFGAVFIPVVILLVYYIANNKETVWDDVTEWIFD